MATNERWDWKHWMLLIVCGVLIVNALVNLAPFFPPARTWLSDPLAPAWVQAVGSIIVIFSGFAVVAVQHHLGVKAAREEDRRARVGRIEVTLVLCLEAHKLASQIVKSDVQSPRANLFLVPMLEDVRRQFLALPRSFYPDNSLMHRVAYLERELLCFILLLKHEATRESDATMQAELAGAAQLVVDACSHAWKYSGHLLGENATEIEMQDLVERSKIGGFLAKESPSPE